MLFTVRCYPLFFNLHLCYYRIAEGHRWASAFTKLKGGAGGEGRGCISIAVVGGKHTNTLHSDWMQIEAQSFHPLLLQGNGNRIRMVETAAENVL